LYTSILTIHNRLDIWLYSIIIDKFLQQKSVIKVTSRRYKILTDFNKVYGFLQDTYDPVTLNGNLLPQYFEYAHMHSYFNFGMTHRFGLWEDKGKIVGIACYEMQPGKCCHLHTDKKYVFLLPELLEWAERELSIKESGNRSLEIWITDKEPNKKELLVSNGYSLSHTDKLKTFDYKKPFNGRTLSEGFSIIDGTKVDYVKLHHCWWKGFDHGDEPDGDFEGRIFGLNAQHADMSLMTIAVAPDGEYACALGMWYDEKNKYAYLEPLATIPKYRRMGLATVCLTESMKKTKALGAEYCFGGSREFYDVIGFETVCNWELWRKEWESDGLQK